MNAPEVAGRRPLLVKFEREGDALFWCACGKSARQPVCDGSHRGTAFSPVKVTARRAGDEALLCACKRTKTPPYCDGSHNALGAYEENDERGAIDWARAQHCSRNSGEFGRAMLDGGCFVLTARQSDGDVRGGWRVLPAISASDGADKLSMFLLEPIDSAPAMLSFGDAEVSLFVCKGDAVIEIGEESFGVPLHSALAVRPGERFRARQRGGALPLLAATVCPPSPPSLVKGPGAFDRRFPNRMTIVDENERQAMGERFYQVLTTPDKGADQVTQFIGAIPKSRATPHRHLYEESLLILSGEGVMWTESRKASVRAGDIVYLPRKQLHCLECASPEGMTLSGSFYPAGSPAINY